MDALAVLSTQVVAALAPFLPQLLGAGRALAEGATGELEGAGGGLARALWARLSARIEGRPAAREAAGDAARQPDDADVRASLRVQLKKLLAEDPDLASELARLLEAGVASRGARTTVIAGGRGAVAAGRDIRARSLSTGGAPAPR